MDYYESGGWAADMEEKVAAAEAAWKEKMDRILGNLELEGKCMECPWIIETAEGFLSEAERLKMEDISPEQYENLRLHCAGCHGKGTGEIQPENEQRLIRDWEEITAFVKLNGMNSVHCPWCPKLYQVYGKYKDPDDEWNALDSKERCMDCKYFGEG